MTVKSGDFHCIVFTRYKTIEFVLFVIITPLKPLKVLCANIRLVEIFNCNGNFLDNVTEMFPHLILIISLKQICLLIRNISINGFLKNLFQGSPLYKFGQKHTRKLLFKFSRVIIIYLIFLVGMAVLNYYTKNKRKCRQLLL